MKGLNTIIFFHFTIPIMHYKPLNWYFSSSLYLSKLFFHTSPFILNDCFESKKSGGKIAKAEPKNPDTNSLMKWACLFLLSLMVTSQIIRANRNKIDSIPFSYASLADMYYKSMKTNPKLWEGLSSCKHLSKNPEYDGKKRP